MTVPRSSKVKDIKPAKAWAAVSNDVPPEMWHMHWYKDQLPDYLRKVRILVTPIKRRRHKR